MNKNTYKNMNKTLDALYEYFFDLQSQYGIPSDDYVPFTIYTTNFYEKHSNPEIEFLRDSKDNNSAFMTTLSECMGNPDDMIIQYIKSCVYMSYENLFELVLDCEMRWDDVLESLKHAVRHELGHVLYARETYIGRPHDEWLEYIQETNGYDIKLLRKNASLKNRIQFILDYMHIPHEKKANDIVGITDEDIIADCIRRNGG